MTFDKWVDAVNAEIRTKLGRDVRTEELSWDSALWVSPNGTAAASVSPDDASAARVLFDGGENVPVNIGEGTGTVERVSALIVERLAVRR